MQELIPGDFYEKKLMSQFWTWHCLGSQFAERQQAACATILYSIYFY